MGKISKTQEFIIQASVIISVSQDGNLDAEQAIEKLAELLPKALDASHEDVALRHEDVWEDREEILDRIASLSPDFQRTPSETDVQFVHRLVESLTSGAPLKSPPVFPAGGPFDEEST